MRAPCFLPSLLFSGQSGGHAYFGLVACSCDAKPAVCLFSWIKIIGAPLAPLLRAGGKTAPPANSAATSLPRLSLYSFRYLWAGEFYLLHRQLKSLPSDMWQYYMEKAGRSGASHSYMSYVAAYTGLFATRVRYVTDVGRSMLSVSFKGSMLGW